MKRKSSQARIEANRRNALKSTGPRTEEGKARSSANATIHGLSSLKAKPLGPGCFLGIEDPAAYQDMLNDYLATYNPQHRDEMDLLREAVYAKFRQERIWHAESGQIEVAIAENERELQRALPTATAAAHLANGFAHSESMVKLYLRYDAQLHRHFKSCLQQLNDLQVRRRSSPDTNPDREGEDPNLVAPARSPNDAIEPITAAPPASPIEPNHPSSPAREQGDQSIAASPSEPKPQPKTDAQLFEEHRERLLQRFYPAEPQSRDESA
ncbi:MAG: hypothetical protein IAF94_27150 [Pirellulaceae bacterium]|nr:hypothetical protein [Pirellulaceae bacterium]